MTLFLCGDVMTGRGIDQVLPHPADPVLHEDYVKDARDYVRLAEGLNGPIPSPVAFSYIWGDALSELDARSPEARIVNLETSVTRSDDYWRGKGINYRMDPANVPCLKASGIDICSLANNHVLDWGYEGLSETVSVLRAAGIETAGAGREIGEAEAPGSKATAGGGRVLVFAFGHGSSGVAPDWAASKHRPGVRLLPDLSDKTVESMGRRVRKEKRPGDVVVASIHWGPNWGYEIPEEQSRFARALIDEAAVDVVHGHSSHHAKGIEVHGYKLILYGCGDLLDDYEGIGGYGDLRSDLSVLYFPAIDREKGRLSGLRLVVMAIRRFRLQRAADDDVMWTMEMLNREGRALGTAVRPADDRSLSLEWT